MQYIAFQKHSVGGGFKVLGMSLKTVVDEVNFIVNLHSFPLLPGPSGKPFLRTYKLFVPFPGRKLLLLF